MGHVVDDPDREPVASASARRSSSRTALAIAGVNSLDDRPYRPPMTCGQPRVAPRAACVDQRGDDVEVERLGGCAGLLGAVEDGDCVRRVAGRAAPKAAAGNGR